MEEDLSNIAVENMVFIVAALSYALFVAHRFLKEDRMGKMVVWCFLAVSLMLAWAGSSNAAEVGRSYLVTPVITVAAYAQGDQIGTYTKLSGFLGSSSRVVDLKNVLVIDKDKQKCDLDLLFFNKLPVLASADNAAVSFTDAVAAASYIGRVSIATADYFDTASNSEAQKSPSLLLAGAGGDLYMVLVCRASGGCDYSATDDLVFRFNFTE